MVALPPFPPRPRRALVALGIVAVTTLLLGLVAVAAAVLAPGGPGHPDEWDPRVRDLAEFVEEERGLRFDHPVHVDFLTSEEYTDQTTEDAESASDADRAELDRYAGELRAMGVASGALDLLAALNQVADGGTLAFYAPDTKRVTVRGTDMTVGLEVTLVHELTHALQDQHFDLQRITASDVDGGASAAFRGLAEGDALRVEQGYRTAELTVAEQDAYDAEYDGQLAESAEATGDVPAFLRATFSAPYALGQPLVVMLVNDGGNDAVDAAFEDPPTTEESLFDPASFRAGEGDDDLDLGFDEDAELFDAGSFGATSWYLVLAERIDPQMAFEAAIGWNGDAFAAFERDGDTCVRLGFVGDAAEDEDQMRAAIEVWVDAMPGGRARLRQIDGHPGIEACDPGEDVDLELTGRSEDSLFLPSLWGFLIADATSELDADGTRCYARAVLDGLTYDQITDPEGAAFTGPAFQQSLLTAFEGCQAG